VIGPWIDSPVLQADLRQGASWVVRTIGRRGSLLRMLCRWYSVRDDKGLVVAVLRVVGLLSLQPSLPPDKVMVVSLA
jgi:hypothetical protein